VEALEIDGAYEAELDTELGMLRDAIVLVAARSARRVVVANLAHGRVLIEPAREIAVDLGVELDVLETSDPRRVDFAVAAGEAGIRHLA
jgi:hypothetical protein